MPYKDKEIHKSYDQKWQKDRIIEMYNIIYVGKVCSKCGSSDGIVYHHRDPSTKLFNISNRLHINKDRLMDEIAKCDILCKSCHDKIHEYSEEETKLRRKAQNSEYRDKHKIERYESRKEYYQRNKHIEDKRTRDYYNVHKNEINARRRERYRLKTMSEVLN